MRKIPKPFKFSPELSSLMDVTVAEGPEVRVVGTDLFVWTVWTAAAGLRFSFDRGPEADYSIEEVRSLRDGLTELINKLEGK